MPCRRSRNTHKTNMWANAQRDGRPAEHKWHPLFNAAKLQCGLGRGLPGGLKTRDRKTRHGQNCRTGKRDKRHVLKAKLRTPHVVVILVWC